MHLCVLNNTVYAVSNTITTITSVTTVPATSAVNNACAVTTVPDKSDVNDVTSVNTVPALSVVNIKLLYLLNLVYLRYLLYPGLYSEEWYNEGRGDLPPVEGRTWEFLCPDGQAIPIIIAD